MDQLIILAVLVLCAVCVAVTVARLSDRPRRRGVVRSIFTDGDPEQPVPVRVVEHLEQCELCGLPASAYHETHIDGRRWRIHLCHHHAAEDRELEQLLHGSD